MYVKQVLVCTLMSCKYCDMWRKQYMYKYMYYILCTVYMYSTLKLGHRDKREDSAKQLCRKTTIFFQRENEWPQVELNPVTYCTLCKCSTS